MDNDSQKPLYAAYIAMTMDGRLGVDSHHMSTDWTSAEDKAFFRAELGTCDVMLLGRNTYETAKSRLSKRNCIVLTTKVAGTLKEADNLLWVNPAHESVAKIIEDAGYKKVAVLGGAQTYDYCLRNNLLDDLYLTMEPIVFGLGIPFVVSKDFDPIKFKLIDSKSLNEQGTLLLHYRPMNK